MVQIYPALARAAQPVCSVCIANYNGVNLLAECIDSVLRQVGGVSVEIIVHDDASADESVSFLRATYPEVEVLASDANVGFCISNNRMAEHARGEFLLLLNNDAALFPDALETLLRQAQKQARHGILTLPQFDWRTGELVDRGCLLDYFYNPIPNIDPTRVEVAMVIGACLWIPRSLWTNLSGFPIWLESIAEDMYLCCQVRLLSLPVEAAVTSGYRHWQGKSFSGDRPPTGLQSTFRRRHLSERNKTYVMAVMTPTVLMWPLLGLHLALLFVEGLLLSAIRWDISVIDRIYIPAITDVTRNIRLWHAQRSDNQKTRRCSVSEYFSPMRLFPHKLRLVRKYGVPKIG